eukprot:CAMPEP_0201284746 /NCGR_PEP_ID=MMETSP1317-20130820/83623_1 /ASSEMBLY_ACC=CAM_ASM_000770 /TAXON_ID=187299 /ORGANISM="Undescribed Undescribed, Strain Undescribed" /LENGTH=407 /DNA_ID=CAMNT_0047606147 /DNA_START=1 /DNA_END=1224 /DNA_ORIENTATION=-
MDLNQIIQEIQEPEDLLESVDDAPIIKLLNALLTKAIQDNASDIHIEPYENRLRIRFRIDGALKEVLEPRKSLAPLIISRIKVMSRLDIAEKRLPQDGRISLRIGGISVDVRVSTIPSGRTERVVMHLLNKEANRLDLKNLGMPENTRKDIEDAISMPHGIILVTGPTGSGKTTTLYAVLSRLKDVQRNIMTVEDPIEFFIDGVNQTQVNYKIGMTFAYGLRAILRQDPDIIMVGEIRDLETAQIAVQASLTGHLVFSTLHTNTAIGAITRLRDMGLESFLLASSLNGVLAQRLVRLLCNCCKQAYESSNIERELLGINKQSVTLYRAVGCKHCENIGYKHRTGIYEFVQIDDTVHNFIHNDAGEQEMVTYIRKRTPSIQSVGFKLALRGDTTLKEIFCVVGDNPTT